MSRSAFALKKRCNFTAPLKALVECYFYFALKAAQMTIKSFELGITNPPIKASDRDDKPLISCWFVTHTTPEKEIEMRRWRRQQLCRKWNDKQIDIKTEIIYFYESRRFFFHSPWARGRRKSQTSMYGGEKFFVMSLTANNRKSFFFSW